MAGDTEMVKPREGHASFAQRATGALDGPNEHAISVAREGLLVAAFILQATVS